MEAIATDDPPPLTREAALRIALAARTLPNIDLADLVTVLRARLGDQLDGEVLRQITVTHLKTGISGLTGGEEDGEDIGIGLAEMKTAVRILWGDTGQDENLPTPEPYVEGDLPGSLRIAIASDKGNALNGHFGSCLRYLVYQVSPTASRLVDVRDALEADFAEDRNGFRVQLIKDCQVLYVVSIGGPAAAKVIRGDIFPIKHPDGGEAAEIVAHFQQAMQSPPPWLLKVLGVDPQQRLKNYRADGDDD